MERVPCGDLLYNYITTLNDDGCSCVVVMNDGEEKRGADGWV